MADTADDDRDAVAERCLESLWEGFDLARDLGVESVALAGLESAIMAVQDVVSPFEEDE